MAKRVAVIGAGAAGLMAAGRAAELGADVVLLEKMNEAGKKILVSGKSRCNMTNAAPLDQFLSHYGRNGRFLMNA
ncbi:MAG: NAD(P)/FAD-dependent oxidoreductase, partial [Anaerolineae bacterium]|nr:NAD(P)/FAD-dependent oxidoreductase [Anaerolineae bacterium]